MTGRPVRLQLSRKRGFNLQALSLATNGLTAVNVARPSKWGNPFIVGRDGTTEECVNWHKMMLAGYDAIACGPELEELKAARKYANKNIDRLHGKNLACWCHKNRKCHAEILLEIAAGR